MKLFAALFLLFSSILHNKLVTAGCELKSEIPSEGTKFYKDYLKKSVPVFYEKAGFHWPATRLWRDLTYVRDTFANENVTVRYRFKANPYIEAMTLYQTLTECKKFELLCAYSIPSASQRILHDVYLPTILQCKDLSKHIENIEFKSDFTNSVPSFTVANDDTIVGVILGKKKVVLVNTSAVLSSNKVDISTFLGKSSEEQNKDVENLLNDFSYNVTLKPGDNLFIPQHWLYQVHQLSDKHNADIFIGVSVLPDQSDEHIMKSSSDFTQNVRKFEELRRSLPPTVPCAENVIPLSESLKISDNEKENLHLRIPKKREKPRDVRLASGYTLPPIGFGTALLYEKTTEAVKTALSNGFRLFDTAQAYGEKGTAAALREFGIPRSEVYLITKLHPKYLGYQTTLDSIKKSMEDLETDYLDVFLIHSQICDDLFLKCKENEPNGTWQESWKAMEEAQRLGWVRSIGVSNFDLKSMKELVAMATVPVSVLQNWFDPMHQDTKVREFCAKHGISYQGYSTLGSQWVHNFGLSYNPVLSSDLILNIAGHYDYVAAHVVLRYAIHKGVTPITSSANPNHIAQSFRSLDISLHSLEIEAIDEFDAAMTEALEELESSSSGAETDSSEDADSAKIPKDDFLPHSNDYKGSDDSEDDTTVDETSADDVRNENPAMDRSTKDEASESSDQAEKGSSSDKTLEDASSATDPQLTDEDQQKTLKTEL